MKIKMKGLRQFLAGLKKGAISFGRNTSLIVNTALLALVYFLGVGIAAVIAKICGKHFLEMRLSKLSKDHTYWSDLNLRKKPAAEHYRQF